MSAAVPLRCPLTHRTRPPEGENVNLVQCPMTSPAPCPLIKCEPAELGTKHPLLADPETNAPLYILASTDTLNTMSTSAHPTNLHRPIARVNTQPKESHDYSAYVPVKIGSVHTAAYIDSGNTFANVISPATMAALGIRRDQLEPVPQLSVGTAAAGKKMKVLGQAPRINLTFGDHPTKFRIRPLVLQGLVHPLNICGPFLSRFGIDQLHSKHALRIQGKEVPMGPPSKPKSLPPLQTGPNVCTLEVPQSLGTQRHYYPGGPVHQVYSAPTATQIKGRTRQVVSLQVRPPLPPGQTVIFRPNVSSGLGPHSVLQNISPDSTISVIWDNVDPDPVNIDGHTHVGALQAAQETDEDLSSVQVERGSTLQDATASAPKDDRPLTSHAEFEALTQKEKIQWLVKNFRLRESELLERDPELRKEVIKTLLEFSDVISIGGYGQTDVISHAITLEPGSVPIKLRRRPLNPIMEESLRKQIDKWLAHDVIEDSDSPWSFPLVPVPKKNSDEIRWAVDYRRLNAITKKDAFPLPNITDNLSRLSGSRVFTALDGAGAFHVVPVRRCDREKTAFSTPFGQYQFARMPFGLANAPATYSRLVSKTLRHLPASEVLCYLDDTAIHSADAWPHLRILRKVLMAFRAAGLQISPEKAQLFRDHILYLGHEASAQGVRIPDEYTKVVRQWPLPDTLKTLRAFLGKCGYYRKFIANYSTVTAPLVQYTQQDRHDDIPNLSKDEAAVQAFRHLKHLLLTAPILAYPQFHGKPFILDTDFSADPGAIGGVLSQEQDGQERVIAYGARRLQPRERAYASTKGELLAVIFFLQYYKYYLLNRPFILRTDNRALTWIRSLESPAGMILRWLEILASFNFTVQHRKGTQHGNADSLSRVPHAPHPSPQEEKTIVSDEAMVAALPAPTGFSLEELKLAQGQDPLLRDVQRWKDDLPSEEERQLLSPDQHRLLAMLPQIVHDPDSQVWIVARRSEEPDTPTTALLYIPQTLRQRVVEAAHQFLGHAGRTATYLFCRQRVYMIRLSHEVNRVLQGCQPCQLKDQKPPVQKDVYRPSVQAGTPFQVWSMDVMGPLRASTEGNRYLLTLKDVFSKWFEAIPLKTTTSANVIKALQSTFARFGYPLQVHTDNATYFQANATKEALARAGIRLTFTPTYNPQSNSVERVHRDLGAMLRALCQQHSADWEEVLPAALLALRSAVHESTGATPFACVYGREPATPLDVLCRFPDTPDAANDHVRRLEAHQLKAHRVVQEHLGRAIHRSARRYGDEKDAIQPGEKVWLFTSKPAADRKLAIPLTGPWRVTGQLGGTLRTIHPEGSWCLKPKSITVSLNRLKRCRSNDPVAPQQVPFDLQLLEGEDEDAEGPMRNTWLTADGDTARQALNQGMGEVAAPAHSRQTRSQGGLPPATDQPCPTVLTAPPAEFNPTVIVNTTAPEIDPRKTTGKPVLTPSVLPAYQISAPIDPDSHQSPDPGPSAAPRSQQSFDQSAAARLGSSKLIPTGHSDEGSSSDAPARPSSTDTPSPPMSAEPVSPPSRPPPPPPSPPAPQPTPVMTPEPRPTTPLRAKPLAKPPPRKLRASTEEDRPLARLRRQRPFVIPLTRRFTDEKTKTLAARPPAKSPPPMPDVQPPALATPVVGPSPTTGTAETVPLATGRARKPRTTLDEPDEVMPRVPVPTRRQRSTPEASDDDLPLSRIHRSQEKVQRLRTSATSTAKQRRSDGDLPIHRIHRSREKTQRLRTGATSTGKLRRLAALLSPLALLSLFCFASSSVPATAALTPEHLLHNNHGKVEIRHSLIAYDCADPLEVRAYSSVPEEPCETRRTTVTAGNPTQFQLLQKESRRYIEGHSCSLSRTSIEYNCGSYDHPELDPTTWSIEMPVPVSQQTCREWLEKRQYQPPLYSWRMYHDRKEDLLLPLELNEPAQLRYLRDGHTFVKWGLPTDSHYQVGCAGANREPYKGYPMPRVTAHFDTITIRNVSLYVEEERMVDRERQRRLPCKWLDGHCRAEGITYIWSIEDPQYCDVALVKDFRGHRLLANASDKRDIHTTRKVEAIVSLENTEKIRLRDEGPSSQCGRVVIRTNLPGIFLYSLQETDNQGNVLLDNRHSAFSRKIHPSEVELEKYIANRDDFLYHDITAQAEREFDALLHQECLRRQEEAKKAHFFEQGMPGYQPFLLQDGIFSTRSGEANYRYRCQARTVHPVSARRCFNKLPVVLRATRTLGSKSLNFTHSVTYYMDPDSRLISPVASEIPCATLFPAAYRTQQGWIVATPEIHQAPTPLPLPLPTARRNESVFQMRDYTQGGLYESETLAALQDFLMAPLIREAVTYKLAYQVRNVQPGNQHLVTPMDMFPQEVIDAASWRQLIFGGWWGWLEEWGQIVSVLLGLYYAYVFLKAGLTACFSLGVLYQEHGLSPNLLWGLGLGRTLFPMRFYRRWREFQRGHRPRTGATDGSPFTALTAPRPPPRPLPREHEYLAVGTEVPPSPRVTDPVGPSLYPEFELSGNDTGSPTECPTKSETPAAALPGVPAAVEVPEVQRVVRPTAPDPRAAALTSPLGNVVSASADSRK